MTVLRNNSTQTFLKVQADVADAPPMPVGDDLGKQFQPLHVTLTYMQYGDRPWFFSNGKVSGLSIKKNGQVGNRHVGRSFYGASSMPEWLAEHVANNMPEQPKEW